MTTKQKLERAKTLLLLDQPFFGTLAVRMPMVESKSIKTASTNGKVIRYNPQFIDSLSEQELVGVLAHEVMHVADGHCWRRGGRDMGEWNEACDYAINSILVEAGLRLPKTVLLDAAYTGAAEEVYAARHRNSQQQSATDAADSNVQQAGTPAADGQSGSESASDSQKQEKGPNGADKPQKATEADSGRNQADGEGEQDASKPQTAEEAGSEQGSAAERPKGQGQKPKATQAESGGVQQADADDQPVPDPGGCGAVEDAPEDEAEAAAMQAEWQVAVAQAAMAARGQGTLPASLERHIKDFIDPKVPWHVLLRDFVERSARNDYAWSRPNARHLQRGFILPGLVSEEIPCIVLAVDTSGSITQSILDQFAAEASAVLGEYDTTMQIVYCDAEIQGTEEVTKADLPIKLEPKGGGGTSFCPVFEWVEQQGLTPSCLIYLTDLYGSFPKNEPPYPVLWAVTDNNNPKAPFGDVAVI